MTSHTELMKEYVTGVNTFFIITHTSFITEWISLSLKESLRICEILPFPFDTVIKVQWQMCRVIMDVSDSDRWAVA